MKVGVLVSGSGTNLQAILDAQRAGGLGPARVAVVLSNVAGVRALERAKAAAVATEVLPHKGYASRQAFDEALVATLRRHDVELVALAGFMRLLTPTFLGAFPGRVMNIHPALLPAFPGVHSQKQALDYGARVTGCTVHFVDDGCDTGPIIAQAAVPVLDDDDVATLTARILVEEHRLYPAAIRAVAEGRVRSEGRRVKIAP
ncbi:MAG TPA: phosphoribosylglycinamide formyltransferase [Polyangia bacterium]|nr:phosphoribosylglycinamide formyltransferase [Polyangia bacterium]